MKIITHPNQCSSLIDDDYGRCCDHIDEHLLRGCNEHTFPTYCKNRRVVAFRFVDAIKMCIYCDTQDNVSLCKNKDNPEGLCHAWSCPLPVLDEERL